MGKLNLGGLFRRAPNLNPDQLREFMAQHPAGSWTLLDVRQPKEYQQSHLPGAELIPLPELKQRVDELDPDKPVVTYCAIGGRSRAAAQFLQGRGFKEVHNLSGGIKAWDGQTAEGPQSWGLELAEPGEGPARALSLAFDLERGLKAAYQALADQAGSQDLAALYGKLAGFEDKHMERLRQAWGLLEPGEREGVELESQEPAPRMEGGWDVSHFVAQHQEQGSDPAQVIMLAMGLETQAMDLYLRLAQHLEKPASQEIFLGLSDEEQSHLEALAQMLEQLT